MTLYDSVISNLKGVIGSRRDGVLLNYLDAEYQSMVGETFPLRKLGYDTIHEFIGEHEDQFRVQGSGRYSRVVNVVGKGENDTTLDLINLIQNTQPKYKNQGYQNNFQSGYQSKYQFDYNSHFKTTNSSNAFGFMHSNSFNNAFPIGFNTDFRRHTNNIETDSKYLKFYQNKETESKPSNGKEELKKSNLLVPMTCLMKAKVTIEKPNVLVISDDDEPSIVFKPSVTTQTKNKTFITKTRSFLTMKSLELVNIIIDVIIEFKQLKYNEILKIKINGDLHYHFRLLTGLNIDPLVFYDYVLYSIECPKIQYLYKGLIYLDTSKDHCFFNTKSIYKTKSQLPEYEFDFQNEYVGEIVKIFHDNLIAYKLPNKLNQNLVWQKTVTSEQTKDIIESQHFWSWIPGSLCLVRLPYTVMKKLNVSSVERAVIIFTEIAKLETESLRSSHQYLFHKTSFYLIDHEVEVVDLMCCASSFQEIKLKVREQNNTDITFVCNMSVSAKNTPSKIQFTALENFKDVSHSFLDNDNKLKQNSLLILKSMKKTSFIFHFQTMYTSFSRIYTAIPEKPLEETQEVKVSEITKIIQNGTKEIDTKEGCQEVIVISDSEDETTVIRPQSIVSSTDTVANNISTPTSSFNQSKPTQNFTQHSKIDLKEIFGDSVRNQAAVSSYSEKLTFKIAPPKKIDNTNWLLNESLENRTYNKQVKIGSIPTVKPHYSNVPISAKSPLDVSPIKSVVANNINCVPKESSKLTQVNGTISTPYYSKTVNNETSFSVSHSEMENGQKTFDENIQGLQNVKDVNKSQNNIMLSNSVISYLENNVNPTRKCLKPLTSDMINVFNGRIVKLLHIQTGSVVVMVYDTIKLMKREIKMAYLQKQALQRAEKVLVGDYFIWRPSNDDSDSCDYFLVEIIQLVSKNTVLINNVHQGLLFVVNITELCCLPDDKNGDIYGNIQILMGPPIGVFDLHMLPDWFTPDESLDFSNQLFTAFFVDDGKLILEYIDEPCRFLNIEMISLVEKSLAVNHCNVKSTQFIVVLSKNLLKCRLFVGNILVMLTHDGVDFSNLSIAKVLRKVTPGDKKDIWFASVLIRNDCDQDIYDKLSPHNFIDDQFSIDRVVYDDRRRSLRLLEHQNVYMDVPEQFEGLYKFDREQVRGSLRSNEEFYTRYMLAGVVGIPDLKFLHTKLIFEIRAF